MCLLILAEYLYILDQWGDGVNGLAVSGKVVIGDIDIEEILPLMTDDRKTLYLGEVYVIEGENGEDLAQTAPPGEEARRRGWPCRLPPENARTMPSEDCML